MRKRRGGRGGLCIFLKGLCIRPGPQVVPSGLIPVVHAASLSKLMCMVFPSSRVAVLWKPQKTLLVPEADMSAALPCNDGDWDGETVSQVSYTLSSPPESLGRYASCVQACYLLSRVFRHASDTSISSTSRQSELAQLDKTLDALIRYSAETQPGGVYSILCYQTAISFWLETTMPPASSVTLTLLRQRNPYSLCALSPVAPA